MLSIVDTTLRCRMCSSEFTDEQVEEATCCPGCRSEQLPVRIAHDVNVTMNWSDLRILTTWAANFIEKYGDEGTHEMMAYLKRQIQPLRPEGALPLTLVEEFQELQDAGHDVELIQNGNVVVPRRVQN